MDRRGLLRFGGQAIIGMVAARIVAGSPFSPLSSERQRTIHKMIAQSGAMWEASRDRQKSPVVVYFGDGPAAELSKDNNRKWRINYRELTDSEADSFRAYTQKYSQHMGSRIGAKVHRYSDLRIRGWVKNGRHPGWLGSVDWKGVVA